MKRPSNHIIDPVNPECAVTAPDRLQSSTSQFSVTTPSGAAHDAPVGGVAVNFGDLIPDDAFHFVDFVDAGTVTTTLDFLVRLPGESVGCQREFVRPTGKALSSYDRGREQRR